MDHQHVKGVMNKAAFSSLTGSQKELFVVWAIAKWLSMRGRATFLMFLTQCVNNVKALRKTNAAEIGYSYEMFEQEYNTEDEDEGEDKDSRAEDDGHTYEAYDEDTHQSLASAAEDLEIERILRKAVANKPPRDAKIHRLPGVKKRAVENGEIFDMDAMDLV